MLQLDHSIAMVGLGSVGHSVLADGVHLRWQAKRDHGFPWYGYYLLRRPHREGSFISLSQNLAQLSPGTKVPPLFLPLATLRSDGPLVLTDLFAPGGQREVALDTGSYLQVDCPEDVRQVRVTLGFRQTGTVKVTVLADGHVVEQKHVFGAKGALVTALFAHDYMDTVKLSAGPAVLADLSYIPVSQEATVGWEFLPDFTYPLGLPVTHGNYPCTGYSPPDPAASQAEAMGRIRYPVPGSVAAAYDKFYDQALKLVSQGPAGPKMCNISDPYVGVANQTSKMAPPTMPALHPLDLVMIGALHPAIAQMAGLYWVDSTAAQTERYDYLIVGNFTDRRVTPKAILNAVANAAMPLPAFICFDLRPQPTAELPAPAWVAGFALPGTAILRGDGQWVNAVNNAGLRWDRADTETDQSLLLADRPVFYRPYRADCGTGATPLAPALGDYFRISEDPVVVSNADVEADTQWPPDWPELPMYAIDRARPDGWYSYAVTAQDIFGRESGFSPAAKWLAKDGVTLRHPFAVELLDRIPPPVPIGVEASALQPRDPLVLKDALYNAWHAGLTPAEQDSVVGLRVKWQWPLRCQQQAPDTQEFRIYYEPGLLNSRPGRTLSVTTSGPLSTVMTDIDHSEDQNAFAGCRLRIRNAFYPITQSSATSPLTLTVANLPGSADDATPEALAPCTVSVAAGHPLHTDYRKSSSWASRIYVVPHVPGKQTYELFLPHKGDADRSGLPLHPDLAAPVLYANISVTAADGQMHTADDSKWLAGPWGNRIGNESAPSTPSQVFAVNRTAPPSPALIFEDTPVYATRADYLSRSWYTHRWPLQPNVQYFVLRAMDQTVCQADWAIRSSPTGCAALTGNESDLYPDQAHEPAWTSQRRQAVAAEINQIQHPADYTALSDHALRVLASLSGCERAFGQLTVQPLDPARLSDRDPADANLMAYTDTLDGRSRNRYLYRVQAIDGAQNRSALSLAGPPVHLYDVVPPRAPVITRILGDERQVLITWAANRETDLAGYLVYRTPDQEQSRDVRLMDLLPAALLEPEPDPKARAGVTFADSAAIPGVTYYYRVAAADTAGNVSLPSAVVAGRAIDTQPPAAPPLNVAEWQSTGGAELHVRIEWPALPPGAQALVQRRESTGADWGGISVWLPAEAGAYADSTARPSKSYLYRLRVKSGAGLLNTTYNETAVKAYWADH